MRFELTGWQSHPFPERAPWKEAYLHELLTFPKGRYDDQVDSTSQALDYIKDVKPESGANAFYRIAAEKRARGLADDSMLV